MIITKLSRAHSMLRFDFRMPALPLLSFMPKGTRRPDSQHMRRIPSQQWGLIERLLGSLYHEMSAGSWPTIYHIIIAIQANLVFQSLARSRKETLLLTMFQHFRMWSCFFALGCVCVLRPIFPFAFIHPHRQPRNN